MTTFDYAAAGERITEQISAGLIPAGVVAAAGYPFAIPASAAQSVCTSNTGDDLAKIGGRWFNVHILCEGIMAQADHHGQTLYGNRFEVGAKELTENGLPTQAAQWLVDSWQRKRSEIAQGNPDNFRAYQYPLSNAETTDEADRALIGEARRLDLESTVADLLKTVTVSAAIAKPNNGLSMKALASILPALALVMVAAAVRCLFPDLPPMPALAIIGPAAIGGITETSKMVGPSFSLPALITCPIGRKYAGVKGTPCEKCYATSGAYQWPMVIAAQMRRLALITAAMVTAAGRKAWAAAFALHLNRCIKRTAKALAKAGAPTKQDIALFYALEAAGARCTAGARRIAKGGKAAKEKATCQALAAAFKTADKAWQNLRTKNPTRAKSVRAWIMHERALFFRFHDAGDVFDPRYFWMITEVARQAPRVNFWLPTQERATVQNYLVDHGALPPNLIVRFSSPKVDKHLTSKIAGTVASSVSTDGNTTGQLCPAYSRGGVCGPCRSCWDSETPLVTYPVH